MLRFSDFKYLIAYLGPIFCLAGLYFKSFAAPGMFYLAFVIIPLLELILPQSDKEHLGEEEKRAGSFFFDLLLYLHIPIVYGLLIYYFQVLSAGGLSWSEQFALLLNMGTLLGAMGINIAHELGHRPGLLDKIASQLLLLPAHYLHFQIEHNLGHHKHVATPEDPSTAMRYETVYAFWLRSVSGVYGKAWAIEAQMLQRKGQKVLSMHNRMIRFTLLQLTYYLTVAFIWSPFVLMMAIIAGILGFLLLETVNYIEHYGLERETLASGRYEPVGIQHSWNSNHPLGRIMLFELTRHADHHFMAQRPYQILRHYDESPQLPMGYPAAMLFSLIPPLWFRSMDHHLPKVKIRDDSKREGTTLSPN
jgi:alkane 1-monooxygenase